jgi:hypothetical protein
MAHPRPRNPNPETLPSDRAQAITRWSASPLFNVPLLLGLIASGLSIYMGGAGVPARRIR